MAKLIRVLSYGGGLDSFAMLIDAIQRRDLPDYCVFMETGEDERNGEWPGTYEHMEKFAKPLCKKHGIKFVNIDTKRYPIRGKKSLLDYAQSNKSLILQGRKNARLCTIWAKVERFTKWANDHLKSRFEVWIGFEAGEDGRVNADPNNSKACGIGLRASNRFPLIEHSLCRCRCEVLARTSTLRTGGFPVPRKSACWYCPFSSRGDWKTLKRQMPDQFKRIADYEARPDVGVTKAGEKLWIMWEEPLKDDVKKSYTADIIRCDTCGRMPRATKATGVDWLNPSEYVQLEDPNWGPLMMHGPEAAVAEMPIGSATDTALVVALGPSEDAVVRWLNAWVDLEFDEHTLFFPADSESVHKAVALLDNYIAWTREGNDYTTTTFPNASQQAESLRDKIQFEASMASL